MCSSAVCSSEEPSFTYMSSWSEAKDPTYVAENGLALRPYDGPFASLQDDMEFNKNPSPKERAQRRGRTRSPQVGELN
jgi:hypothetical protein